MHAAVAGAQRGAACRSGPQRESACTAQHGQAKRRRPLAPALCARLTLHTQRPHHGQHGQAKCSRPLKPHFVKLNLQHTAQLATHSGLTMGLKKMLPGWETSGRDAESPQLLHSKPTMAAPPEAMNVRSASALLPTAELWPAGKGARFQTKCVFSVAAHCGVVACWVGDTFANQVSVRYWPPLVRAAVSPLISSASTLSGRPLSHLKTHLPKATAPCNCPAHPPSSSSGLTVDEQHVHGVSRCHFLTCSSCSMQLPRSHP